jgi:hypothetical protein
VISSTPIAPASDESFTTEMYWLTVGGSMRRRACGSTMRRIAVARDMPKL